MLASQQSAAPSVLHPEQVATDKELPAATTKWTPRRKAQVVAAVRGGSLDLEEACDRYRMTVEEFLSWEESLDREGLDGLSAVRRDERRKTSRRAVQEPALVAFRGGANAACTITNIGSGGARLEFEVAVPLPEMFELHSSKSRRAVLVRLVWQRDRSAGVCFETAIPIPLMQDSLWGEWLLGER